jgi:hypothetical protein
MARQTSTVLWSIAGCVLLGLTLLGFLLGPDLWREGRALIGPIRELSKSQEALEQLNARIAFEAPADGVVSEERLQVFLAVRAELEERYVQWSELVDEISADGDESLDAAKRVLAETRDVMHAQIEILERHQMSGTELIWLEDQVYRAWLDEVESTVDEQRHPVVLRRLREIAEEDLAWLDQLENRQGMTPTTRALRDRIDARLSELTDPSPPVIDGIPAANQELLWRYRDEISRLDLSEHRGIHDERFRGEGKVRVTVGNQEE